MALSSPPPYYFQVQKLFCWTNFNFVIVCQVRKRAWKLFDGTILQGWWCYWMPQFSFEGDKQLAIINWLSDSNSLIYQIWEPLLEESITLSPAGRVKVSSDQIYFFPKNVLNFSIILLLDPLENSRIFSWCIWLHGN